MTDYPQSLVGALIEARRMFPAIHRDRTNTHFGSKYVSLDAILAAVMQPLGEVGILLTQHVEILDLEHDVTALVTTVEKEGESRSSTTPICASRANPQAFGSALTYARRQGLSTLLGISVDDDDDANAAQTQTKNAPHTPSANTPKVITPADKPADTQPQEAFPIPPSNVPPAGEVVVHFGKNKGARLCTLPRRSLEWYVETWEPSPNPRTGETNKVDIDLKAAAVAYKKHLEGRTKAASNPDDDIPF